MVLLHLSQTPDWLLSMMTVSRKTVGARQGPPIRPLPLARRPTMGRLVSEAAAGQYPGSLRAAIFQVEAVQSLLTSLPAMLRHLCTFCRALMALCNITGPPITRVAIGKDSSSDGFTPFSLGAKDNRPCLFRVLGPNFAQYPNVVCDGRDVGGHIWVAARDADVPFGALAESGCVPFLDGLPCPASPQLYAGAMITLRPTHSSGRPNMMPVSAWWHVHPFSALISSPVPFPAVAPESFGFQNAAIREAFNALLDVRVARGFALFEGRVAIFGPGSSLVFASGQASPTAERLAQDLSVYLLRTFGPGQIAFTRLHLADCAMFAYRPDSLRSDLSLCLHSLGGGYVLRVVPTADLRTIQEPIFLFPGIDSPVARVSDPATHEPASASAEASGDFWSAT